MVHGRMLLAHTLQALTAFEGLEVVTVSTDPPDADLEGRHYRVRNVTRRNRLAFAVTIRQIHAILRRERPDAGCEADRAVRTQCVSAG